MAMDRRSVLGALAGSSAITLAGCIGVEEGDDGGSGGNGDEGSDGNDGDDDPTDVDAAAEIWFALTEGELDQVEGYIEEFNAETGHDLGHADVAELEERLVTTVPAGDGPELFLWAHDWVGDFTQSGFLSDQSGELDVDLSEEYTEPAAEAVQWDGQVVGLPYASETVGLICNDDLVDEPPETLEEMQAIMDEYVDEDGMYGLSYPMDPYFISGFAHTFGGYYYDEEANELGLTNEETLDGFRIVLDELRDYVPNDPDYDAQAAVFAEGNAPFAINGPWYIADLDFDVSVTALPEVDGDDPSPYTGVQMVYFADAMDEGGEAADIGRDFAEWYTTNTELLAELSNEQGYTPVHQDLVDSDDVSDVVQGYADAAANGRPMPTHPNMNQVWEPVEDAFINAFNEDMSVEDAMAQAEERIRSNWD